METKFNFKSAVCTSREQSEKLLALGLKKETADCYLFEYDKEKYKVIAESWLDLIADEKYYSQYKDACFPAWSLGRLLAFVNGEDWRAEITLKDERYGIHYGYESYWYDNIFDAVIAWIEDDIKEGYFNKEYLV